MHFQISPYPRFAEPSPQGTIANWATFLGALAPNIQHQVAKSISSIEKKLGVVDPTKKPMLVARRTNTRISGGLWLGWYTREHYAEMLLNVRELSYCKIETRSERHKLPEVSAIATILWAAPWWRAYMRGSIR